VAARDRLDITLARSSFNETALIASTLEEAHAYLHLRNPRYGVLLAGDGGDGLRELAQAAQCNGTVAGER
jgi:hypothetical protein